MGPCGIVEQETNFRNDPGVFHSWFAYLRLQAAVFFCVKKAMEVRKAFLASLVSLGVKMSIQVCTLKECDTKQCGNISALARIKLDLFGSKRLEGRLRSFPDTNFEASRVGAFHHLCQKNQRAFLTSIASFTQ